MYNHIRNETMTALRSLIPLCGLAFGVCLIFYAPAQAQISFTRIVSGNPVDDGGISAGVAWGDYTNNGNYDLFISNWQNNNNFLYLNDGLPSYTFTRELDGDIVNEGSSTPYSSGACWGDYNNDGFLDMFVANQQGVDNFLYLNNGDSTFTKITGQDIVVDGGASFTSAWGDYDNDGWLDLYVANIGVNFLYHNNGDLTFTRITAGDIVNDDAQSFGAAWGDYNNDGYLDLFVANRNYQNNCLYRNNGGVDFTKIIDGPIVNDGLYSHGGSWGDYDNDGDLDLFVANGYTSTDKLYRNDGGDNFTDTEITEIPENSDGWNGTWGDYDNDGWLDLFVTNYGQPNFLYANNGDGTFTSVTDQITVITGYGSGNAAADYDHDGDLDICIANWNNQNNYLFRNNATGNNWLGIRCVGVVSNSFGVGAKVRVKAEIDGTPVWQWREIRTNHGHRSQNPTVADFGLDQASIVDSVIILWPSGIADTTVDIVPNQKYAAVEGSGLLCSGTDSDTDGLPDVAGACPADNCPEIYNPDQADLDGDGIGDVCDCDCGVWGDVTGDGNINPVDVVYMVNKVYLDNDMIVQHPDCPRDAADVNCDGNVNPVDVVFFVNCVYLSNDMFCSDPCGE